ncbi:MAG: ATP-binding protein, partial [Eubacteriales bacterium]|nr:ATP-binding protein [Eubacteriales bacterium]
MEITAETLSKNTKEYQIYDIRGEVDRLYGIIPGSFAATEESIFSCPPEDKQKPIVIVCARGQISLDIAEKLCGMGYAAYSLRGGYAAWLREEVKKQSTEDEAYALRKKVEESIQKKFHSALMSPFTKALKDYELVKDGDRVAVCMSGGKDSMLMAMLFHELMRYSTVKFEVEYLVMDPGYNEANRKILEDNAKNLGIPIKVFETRIFESVYKVEKSPCYLCARMRRGYLYSFAKELGCNKIALGHHYDDVIETLLMGLLHSGQIQGMMPKLHSTNYPGMELIRPLYLIREDDIKAWRDYNGLHFLQCACKFTDTCTT